MILWGPYFITWSMVIVFSQGPMWYYISKLLAYSPMGMSEEGTARFHKDTDSKTHNMFRGVNSTTNPCVQTNKLLRSQRYVLQIRDTKPETSQSTFVSKRRKILLEESTAG